MKKNEIKVGGLYAARVSGNYVTVRVDAIRERDDWKGRTTVYDVTNLKTGRKTTFRSAAKFRGEVKRVQVGNEPAQPDEPSQFEKRWEGDAPITDEPTFNERVQEAIETSEPTSNPRAGKKLGRDEDDSPESVARDIEDGYRCEHGVNIPEPCTECQGGRATRLEGEQSSDPTEGAPNATSPSTATASVVSDAPSATTPAQVATTEPSGEGEQGSDPTNETPTEKLSPRATLEPTTAKLSARMSGGATGNSAEPTSLASRIAAQATPLTITLTAEQEEIIVTAKWVERTRGNGQRVLVIGAGAGTGKTFELKQLEQVLQGNGQYTAFNASLVAESKAKFTRAACNTTHSLAFRAVGRRFVHRLNGPRVRSHEIASRLGIEDFYVELPESVKPRDEDGKPATRRLKASWLAGQVTQAIRKFCMSDDPRVGTRHLQAIAGVDAPGDHTNSNKVKEYLLPFAEKLWADLSSERGTMPFAHDVYVKLWQLGQGPDRPVIAADYILLDEAQDTAPVMLDILQQQTHALLILVGDDNQQIYEWRGAVNAMASFPDAPRRLLSQSFRFGQAVADVANSVLSRLEQPTDLVMRGDPTIPSRVCEVANPRCYLYRTNAGAVGKLMAARAESKRGHLIGGSKEVVAFCTAAIELQAGQGTQHQELGCFQTWAEVQEYSKEDEGADLRLMVKLIDEFGAEEIRDALQDMPQEDQADLILSTAHRSKGREWSSVRLGPDFPVASKLSDADIRLIYVAATRAKEELDVSECPTFCGGWDRKGGGEDGDGGAEWVPGIEINYTAPMPTAEELVVYRERRAIDYVNKIESEKLAADPKCYDNQKVELQDNTAPAAVGNGNASQEFTWANMDGVWCVRGPANQEVGSRVTVVRKNGTRSQETLRSVSRRMGEVWFYGIR